MYYIRRLLYVYTAVLLCTVQLDGGCMRLLLLVFMVYLMVTLDGYARGGVIGGGYWCVRMGAASAVMMGGMNGALAR